MKRLIVAASAALMLIAAPVIAQEAPSAYVWITFVKAKPGQSDAVVAEMLKEDSRVLDSLVDSGAAFEWGIAMPVVHDGKDPYSHVEWVTFNGWAGADAFMKRFMELRKADGDAANKAMADRWAAIVEPGSHADLIVAGLHANNKPKRAGYIHLSYNQAKPGRHGDMRKAYMEYAAPVLDKLVADGTIDGYGLATPELHRGENWSYMSWYKSENLAARDKVSAAFDAANEARSEDERKAMRDRNQENADWSGHSDQILMVLHHKFSEPK